MRLVRMQIGRLDHFRRAGQLVVHVPRVDDERIASRFLRLQVLVKTALTRQANTARPRDLQFAGGLDGLPRLLAHNADEVVLGDDLHEAGQIPNRALVHAGEGGPDLRRPDDPAVQHSRHAHVVNELKPSRCECGGFEPRHRRDEHRPLARMLALGRPAHGQIEFLPADQVAIAHRSNGGGLRTDDAVFHRESIGRGPEACRCKLDQCFACRGSRLRQICLVEVRRVRLAPGRRALIGRNRSVALYQLHATYRYGDLFRDQLRLRRVQALPQFALARVGGDVTFRANRDPPIELIAARSVEPLSRRGLRCPEAVGQLPDAEADDERAGPSEKAAPRQARLREGRERVSRERRSDDCRRVGVTHAFAPSAYRLIARSMRVCAPHRQRTVAIACRI